MFQIEPKPSEATLSPWTLVRPILNSNVNVRAMSTSAGTNARSRSHESGLATPKKGETSNSTGTNARS